MSHPHWLMAASVLACAANAQSPKANIGINVLLDRPIDAAILEELNRYGPVLDEMPEIHAVAMRARAGDLPAIRSLSGVRSASPDSVQTLAAMPSTICTAFPSGTGLWNLDAVDVADAGGVRTVAYDGTGVYVAVIDTGLPFNWREYFPEERIATEFARAFGGGGGEVGTVSSQPNLWERDTAAHGMQCTAVILGFRFLADDPLLPAFVDGVAPGATVIPIKAFGNNIDLRGWSSTSVRSILYVTELKTSGALGDAPVVISASWGNHENEALLVAAVDYALSQGVFVVAACGNSGEAGMIFPAAHPPVISVAASCWAGQVPLDDPTHYEWNLRDVPEGQPQEHFVPFWSSRALPGQDLDVSAPGAFVPVPITWTGVVDYGFFFGTSAATPHVAGVVALMLEKNPHLAQRQIEAILESTAMPLAPDCRESIWGSSFLGWHVPLLSNGFAGISFAQLSMCWGADATGAGVLQAAAALAATPMP